MLTAIVAFLLTCNPAAATVALAHDRRTDRPVPILGGSAAAALALAAVGAGADPILDVLEVSLGTFRIGAGVVVAVSGLRWLVAGAPKDAIEPETDLRLAGFVAFPTLLTPAAAVLAVAIGADDGLGAVAVGAGIAIALGGAGIYARRSIPHALALAGVRLVGAGAIVVGAGLLVDGLRTL